MDDVIVWAWMAGALAVAGIAVAFMVRKARKRPLDPEENLRLLIGPRGMALRDRNRAASQEKWDAEFLESVTNAASRLRAEGDLPGAHKLDAYALTLRTRIQGPEHPNST